MMKEFFQALESRIRSPLLGYYSLAFFGFNWKPIFYLFADDGKALDRISYFQSHTDILSVLVFPLALSALFAAGYPWINYIFLYLCRIPTELKNTLQAQSEHRLLSKKQELEKVRNELLSAAEQELIDRAKRDVELEEIEDDEAKNEVKSKIEELRNEANEINNDKLKFVNPEQLLSMAEKFRKSADQYPGGSQDNRSLSDKARKLEEKAHNIMMGEEPA